MEHRCAGRKQSTIALSSTEAKYVALTTASTEVVWTRNLLIQLRQITEEPIVIFEDNQSCIHLLNKWEHQRLKHLNVKYNYLKELVEWRIINVKYISTNEQKVDILTKALKQSQFIKLREYLSLRN